MGNVACTLTLDPSRWETSACTLTILDKPTSAAKYASGLCLKDPIEDLVSPLVIVALEVAEKLAAFGAPIPH